MHNRSEYNERQRETERVGESPRERNAQRNGPKAGGKRQSCEREAESGIAKKLLSGRAAAAIAYNNEFKAPLA